MENDSQEMSAFFPHYTEEYLIQFKRFWYLAPASSQDSDQTACTSACTYKVETKMKAQVKMWASYPTGWIKSDFIIGPDKEIFGA